MDFNPRKEKLEPIKWNSDDQEGSEQARSYTCTFCKKGFSNAQALGGHMNIHRRDRAKLRQSSEENLLSLAISIKNATFTTDHHEPSQPLEEKILFQLESCGEKITQNRKSSCSFPEKCHNPRPDKMIRSSELDLELRLGPEPQKAPTLSTRESF